MKKILILLAIFKATLPNACTEMCLNENNAFLRDRCLAQAFQQNAISANDLASNLNRDINETDLNYNPISIRSSLTGSNVASSNAYNFFLDPGYNMFMGNYGMGPTSGSYANTLNYVCTPRANVGSNPVAYLGNNTNTSCGTSSVFFHLLVGWAERNVIPNPSSFQYYLSKQLYDLPLTLPPNTGDSAQDPYFNYLVGDPNCPAAVNPVTAGSCSFTHFKGCRICDQFLANGQSTMAYKFCQFGFNWCLPFAWYGNGCNSINNQNICIGGSNLLAFLYTWMLMWNNQGSWYYLNYESSQYAPIPSTFHDLFWLWGKNGYNADYANFTDCLSRGKNNLCDNANYPIPSQYSTNLIYDELCSDCGCSVEDATAYSGGYACLEWDAPGFKPCLPCASNSGTPNQWCALNQGVIGSHQNDAGPTDPTNDSSLQALSYVADCQNSLLSPVSDNAIASCNFKDGTNSGNTSNCPYPNMQ